jgi:hypothetical protein
MTLYDDDPQWDGLADVTERAHHENVETRGHPRLRSPCEHTACRRWRAETGARSCALTTPCELCGTPRATGICPRGCDDPPDPGLWIEILR